MMDARKDAEDAEVAAARSDVDHARRALDEHPGDAREERLGYARQRERMAADAKRAGDRRRERARMWRAIVGMRPAERAEAAEAPGVRRATLDYLDERPGHDDGEDLHPPRLDPSGAKLDDALAERLERREARDA